MSPNDLVAIPGTSRTATVAQLLEVGKLYAAWMLKPGMATRDLMRVERAMWKAGLYNGNCPACQTSPCKCEGHS